MLFSSLDVRFTLYKGPRRHHGKSCYDLIASCTVNKCVRFYQSRTSYFEMNTTMSIVLGAAAPLQSTLYTLYILSFYDHSTIYTFYLLNIKYSK